MTTLPRTEPKIVALAQEMVTHQMRNKEFEYRVIAINKAGQGEASNTVLVVL